MNEGVGRGGRSVRNQQVQRLGDVTSARLSHLQCVRTAVALAVGFGFQEGLSSLRQDFWEQKPANDLFC